ncbi:MAG: NTP transferase domain-containing protein [bacterium]|nr:NTP transferase domain-containing protein [bacterium]
MNYEHSDVAAIILAGGYGRRVTSLGAKPLLNFHDKTFTEIIVDNLKGIAVHSIILVTNAELHDKIKKLTPGLRLAINNNPSQGMFSSLKIGLKLIQASSSGFFLCPVDFPLVSPKTFRILYQNFVKFPSNIIKPSYHGKAGHPIIVPQQLYGELMTAPLSQSPRQVLRQHIDETSYVDVPDSGVITNINTVEAYMMHCR